MARDARALILHEAGVPAAAVARLRPMIDPPVKKGIEGRTAASHLAVRGWPFVEDLSRPASQPSPALIDEAALLARYVAGIEATPVVAVRYARACEVRLAAPPHPREAAVLAFARRHPWALPLLDAAAGLLRPQSLLRRKLILMLAIVETMPEHAAMFVSAPHGRARTIARVLWWSGMSLLKLIGGLVLYPLASRPR